MANTFAALSGYVSYILSALGIIIVTVWLGVALLVPQYPFHHRDIPTGVCLIVFATLIGVIGGVIFGGLGYFCGLACASAVDCCCGDESC